MPGDVHLHFFGTATVSFVDNIKLQAGDEFEVDLPALGAPLVNRLLIEPGGLALHDTRALVDDPREVCTMSLVQTARALVGLLVLAACSRNRKTSASCSASARSARRAPGDARTRSPSSPRRPPATSTCVSPTRKQKQENQIAAMRGFIASKVDVIAFAPVVATGWEPC